MKINMVELRRLVTESLRRTLVEAKGKKGTQKDIPTRTEDAELKRRSNATRATGYSHMKQGDFSEPLGPANLAKRQGAANFGGYTSEDLLRNLVDRIVAEELSVIGRR